MRKDVRIPVAIVKVLVADNPCCCHWRAARLHLWQSESCGGSVSDSDGAGDGHGVVVLDL